MNYHYHATDSLISEPAGAPRKPQPAFCCPNVEGIGGYWISRRENPYLIRPIRKDDGPVLLTLYRQLTNRSIYLRFLHIIKPEEMLSRERLDDICSIDCDLSFFLVVERERTAPHDSEIIAIASLDRLPGLDQAEFAITVRDDRQGEGIGSELLRHMIDYAQLRGIGCITYTLLPENTAMRRIGEKHGFDHRYDAQENLIRAELRPADAAPRWARQA